MIAVETQTCDVPMLCLFHGGYSVTLKNITYCAVCTVQVHWYRTRTGMYHRYEVQRTSTTGTVLYCTCGHPTQKKRSPCSAFFHHIRGIFRGLFFPRLEQPSIPVQYRYTGTSTVDAVYLAFRQGSKAYGTGTGQDWGGYAPCVDGSRDLTKSLSGQTKRMRNPW